MEGYVVTHRYRLPWDCHFSVSRGEIVVLDTILCRHGNQGVLNRLQQPSRIDPAQVITTIQDGARAQQTIERKSVVHISAQLLIFKTHIGTRDIVCLKYDSRIHTHCCVVFQGDLHLSQLLLKPGFTQY
jgi:hypothetical protein